MYLKTAEPYNIIYSAWTIHNFTKPDRKRLFTAIYDNLKKGGTFILMDKVYPNKNTKELLDHNLNRYKYLPPKIAEAIIDHEKIDASDKYRMEEKPLISLLKEIRFKDVRIVDRVERETVFVAQK